MNNKRLEWIIKLRYEYAIEIITYLIQTFITQRVITHVLVGEY